MKVYRCVDMLNIRNSEYIEAVSPASAIKKYFQKYGIEGKPVKPYKQTHKRKYDSRFYVRTDRDTIMNYNREGFEFCGSTLKEFSEKLGENLTWDECNKL